MRVLRFILRRLALLVPVLLSTLFIAFFLTRILPGNPIDRVAGPYISQEKREAMKREARLDLPFYQQFYLYIADLVTKGDIGTSYTTAQPVSRDLLQRFPATFELVFHGMFLAVAVAIPFGFLSALYKDSPVDHASRVIAVVGVSVPVFWLGLVLLYVFFLKLQWVPPPIGRLPPIMSPPPHVTGLYTLDAVLAGQWDVFRAALSALVLPSISLALTAMAPLARMTRAAMVEALESEYVRAARALGLPPRVIVWDYAFRNAVIPVLTIFTGVFGYALGGVVLVEFVFSWPGLGLYTLHAILSSDFPAIQGAILLVTTAYVLIYLLLDLAVAAIDPRVEV
jgi:peptide/nickel transport system permease protein